MSDQPTLARRALGARLRRLREAKGETPAETAAVIGYNRNVIGRIEAGVQGIKKPVIEALCRHFEVGPEEFSHLTTLALRGKEKGWWEPYFDIGAEETSRPKIPLFLETEQVALRARYLETEVVPGPLQTKDVLRELQAAQLPMPEEVAESWRQLRTHRQKLLYGRKRLPRLEFLIGRAAIDYLDEMPTDVREGQIARLLEVSVMPTAEVRVITGLHAGTAGAFSILNPADETEPFVFMDSADGCRYLEQPLLVLMYEQIFDAARLKSIPIEEYLR